MLDALVTSQPLLLAAMIGSIIPIVIGILKGAQWVFARALSTLREQEPPTEPNIDTALSLAASEDPVLFHCELFIRSVMVFFLFGMFTFDAYFMMSTEQNNVGIFPITIGVGLVAVWVGSDFWLFLSSVRAIRKKHFEERFPDLKGRRW